MVKWWITKEAVAAKVTESKDGSLVMMMEGEKYPFPGYPRGHLLYGSLSPLKHEIKNQVFNDIWKKLEEGISHEQAIADIKGDILDRIIELAEPMRYDMLPFERLSPPVKEIWRAWTVVEGTVSPQNAFKLARLKEILCFILQEDDGYRFRVQWLVNFFNPSSLWRKALRRKPVDDFKLALEMIEHAEVIGDMKERMRLLRRILLLILEDDKIRTLFDRFCAEVDWNKVKLSKADKYFFRAKYFKVDWPVFDY